MSQPIYNIPYIIKGNVIFPEDKEGQHQYADALLVSFPGKFEEKQQLLESIISQVGEARLLEGKEARDWKVGVYVWTEKHPNWALVLKVISLGILAGIAYMGHKLYQDNPLIKISERMEELEVDIKFNSLESTIDRIDTQSLRFKNDLLNVTPPKVTEFKGDVDILELLDILRVADELYGFVPETYKDPGGYGHSKISTHTNLRNFFVELNGRVSNERLRDIPNILKHYTAQVKQRLKESQADIEETRAIYAEVVEYIGKGLGMALHHCVDAKRQAARVIFDEKIDKGVEGKSTEMRVKAWVALKRYELIKEILNEMLSNVRSDIASGISNWCYQLRGELGLGDVPVPAHPLGRELVREKILLEFNKRYTPEWLLGLSLGEYAKKEGGESALQMEVMHDFLKDHVPNFEVQAGCMLDDDWKLKTKAMIFYLKEVGVFV